MPSSQPSTQPSGSPTLVPTSIPTFVAEEFATVWDRRRYRTTSICENNCNGHGYCATHRGVCQCYKDLNGEDLWTGPDCSLRACPK